VKYVQNKYVIYGDFLSSSSPSSTSWLWKGIQKSRSLISMGSCLQVSMNFDFPVWTTSLIPTILGYMPKPWFPNIWNLPTVLISDFIILGTNKWNLQALSYLFDAPSICEIAKIHISLATQQKFLWTFSTSGKFTTNSADLTIQHNRSTITSLPGTSPTFLGNVYENWILMID
jgi:hypothetical protein